MTRKLFAISFVVVSFLATFQFSSTVNALVTAQDSYRFQDLGKVKGAVDIVERSPSDLFIYVVSQSGIIYRKTLAGRNVDRVLDISKFTNSEGEQGLLGLTFRRVQKNWEAFINYTDLNGDTVIARYEVHADGTFIVPARIASTSVLKIPQPYSNHNGGAVKVGPDNMLYIATGDGGSSGDPDRHALDMSSWLGKILRIDPISEPQEGAPRYLIPPTNPFLTSSRPEIWSIGLRNPWRFSFDETGNLWVADVGQNKYEEASFAASTDGVPGGRGVNFGWSAYEANERFNQDQSSSGVTFPFLTYQHTKNRCSISGGAVATKHNLRARTGWYFYGDYCDGTIRAVKTDGHKISQSETVGKKLGNITAVVSTSRAMYYLTLAGSVKKITTK